MSASRPRTRPPRERALRSAWRPIAAYWVMLVVLFGAFCVAAVIDDPSGGTVVALALLGGTTAAAVAVGQVMALLRVRDWVVYLFSLVWWAAGAVMSASLGMAAGPLGALAGFVVFIFPFMLTGGLWSLRTGRALFAAWVPLMFASGAAILVAEQQGKVATWQAGSKWAIWDISTFGVLVVGIVLLLAYLLAREGYRLSLWRSGPQAPLPASSQERSAGRPRLTLLGWIILCGLAFGLAVGAAVLSPYLWRTHEDEDGTASDQPDQAAQQDEQAQPQPEPDQGQPREGKGGRSHPSRRKAGAGEGGRMVEVREDARPDQRGQGGVVIDPLLILALLLAGLALGGLPARRLLVVERLKRPQPGTSATSRIEGWWRLVEISLLDAGVELRPGESPQRLLTRASPVLRGWHPLDVEGLAEAALIRDRVAYGLGVDPRDLTRMEEVAVTCFETIWDRIGDAGQIRALYRPGLADPGDADVG